MAGDEPGPFDWKHEEVVVIKGAERSPSTRTALGASPSG
jgi:hypothetical protein